MSNHNIVIVMMSLQLMFQYPTSINFISLHQYHTCSRLNWAPLSSVAIASSVRSIHLAVQFSVETAETKQDSFEMIFSWLVKEDIINGERDCEVTVQNSQPSPRYPYYSTCEHKAKQAPAKLLLKCNICSRLCILNFAYKKHSCFGPQNYRPLLLPLPLSLRPFPEKHLR